jgi:hypothetical protein
MPRNIWPLPLPSNGGKMRRRYFPLACVTIQFELPVDNPVNNVRVKGERKGLTIFVPINYPDVHKKTPLQLLKDATPVELSTVLTTLNNTAVLSKEVPVVKPLVSVRPEA